MNEEIKGTVPELYKCACGGTAYIWQGETGYSVRCEKDPGMASVPVFQSQKKAVNAWNKEQENMDQLTADAVCAYHAGTSYGKYIARIPIKPQAVRFPKREKEVKSPVLELRCLHCNMLIPPGWRSKKYCSETCAVNYREKQARIRKKLAKEIVVDPNTNLCALCGKPVPPDSGRYKYCCKECASKAAQLQRIEIRRKRKAARG